MFKSLGPLELSIILIIILVLFGRGRIGQIFGELGSGINAFKKGLSDEEAEEGEAEATEASEEDAA
jgi:sec-independent protein translocase protein TatA